MCIVGYTWFISEREIQLYLLQCGGKNDKTLHHEAGYDSLHSGGSKGLVDFTEWARGQVIYELSQSSSLHRKQQQQLVSFILSQSSSIISTLLVITGTLVLAIGGSL
jgi:hypothetical protein